jgi:Ca2+-binding EF-hand superfamily protein
MDRSSSTKQIHYVFEKNSQPNQANQNKSKIENNKTDKIRNLGVKKESITIEGVSHKFIIFYESETLSAEKIFNNPFVKLKTENNTKAVQKNFRNLLLNKKIDPNKITTIEESLFVPINVPRPFNKSEKSILNKLNNISDESNKLANELTELKSDLNNKEIALDELNNFLKNFKELNLASDEVKNLFHTIYDGNLSDAELISLLKPISVSNEKRKIEEELKNLDSNSGKLSDKEFSILNDILAGLYQELDVL